MSNQLAKEIFLSALAVISERDRWTQGEGARNEWGGPTSSTAPEAVCWCSVGALFAITSARPLRAELVPIVDYISDALSAAAKQVVPDIADRMEDDVELSCENEAFVGINDLTDYETTMRMWELAGKNEGWLS